MIVNSELKWILKIKTYRIWLGFVMTWTLWMIVYRTRLIYSVFQWNSQFTVTSAFESNWTFCEYFLVEIIFEDWNIFWRISVLAISLFSLGKSILTFSATSLRTASGISRFDTEKKKKKSTLHYILTKFSRNSSRFETSESFCT